MTNTYLPAGPGGNTLERESLRELVTMLANDETPHFSNIDWGNASAIKIEWGTQDIGAVVAAPARNRGFVAAPQAPFTPVRLDNRLQLCAVEFGVSDSMRALDAAGGTNSVNNQRLKFGIQLRRNINKLLYTPQIKKITEPTEMGTFPTYVTNYKNVATGGTTTAPAGNGTALPASNGTKVQFDTIDAIDDVMEAATAKQGVPMSLMMNPALKRRFSRLPDASVAENRINMTAGRQPTAFMYVGTVDLYLSDFGLLEVAVDIDAPNASIYMINWDYYGGEVLPGMDFDEFMLGRRGSGEEWVIQWEGAIWVDNPTSHGFVTGFDPTLP